MFMNLIQKRLLKPMIDFQDKSRGSLVGGAVGDTLGYEVEFMSLPAILKRFGRMASATMSLTGTALPSSLTTPKCRYLPPKDC